MEISLLHVFHENSAADAKANPVGPPPNSLEIADDDRGTARIARNARLTVDRGNGPVDHVAKIDGNVCIALDLRDCVLGGSLHIRGENFISSKWIKWNRTILYSSFHGFVYKMRCYYRFAIGIYRIDRLCIKFVSI